MDQLGFNSGNSGILESIREYSGMTRESYRNDSGITQEYLGDSGRVRDMTKAKERPDALDFLGGWPACDPIHFDSMASCPGLMTIPRYSTSVEAKQHFSSLRWRSSSVIRWRMHLVHSWWVSSSGEKMRRSSM